MSTKKFLDRALFHRIFLLLLLSSALCLAAADTGRFLGLQFGTISSPLGEEDPFAFPLGVGLFCEFHPPAGAGRLFWGASALYYRFNSQDTEYEDSFMVQAGLLGGFDILLKVDGKPEAALTPFFGIKEYYRAYRFRGVRVTGYRSIAVAGARLALLVTGAFLIGFDVEYNLFLEEDPVGALACYQCLGIRF